MPRRIAVLLLLLAALSPRPGAVGQELPGAVTKARALADEGSFEAAMEILREALDADPANADVLFELGRIAWAQGQDILASSNPTLGRLAFLDSLRWLKKAVEARPEWSDALVALGTVAVEMREFETAEDAWRRAAELDPANGEACYQLGFSLAYLLRFEEAIRAFGEAERTLGPDPRILLNRGICHYRLKQIAPAEQSFLQLLRGEVAGDRRGSDMMSSAFTWLWRIHSERNDHPAAAAVFVKVTEEFPDLAGGWWYLGHARIQTGDPGAAVPAFEKVTELQPTWTDGWWQLGSARVEAELYEPAIGALDKLIELDPAGQGTQSLLLAIVSAFVNRTRAADALDLLDRIESHYPGDPILLEKRGDILFRLGRHEDAIRDYRASAANDPFGEASGIKEQKAATALLRAGESPDGLAPLRPGPEEDLPPGTGGPLFDFEGSRVFVRAYGGATGVRAEGGFRLTRTGDAGAMANLALTFIPTIDTRPWTAVRFTVRGPKGKSLALLAKDCYDEFGMSDRFLRLLHPETVVLTGERQVVSLPLDAFASRFENRSIRYNPARLRMLVFEIGWALAEGAAPAEEVWIDDVEFVATDGKALPIETFGRDPAETLFLTDGAASAFARTLFSDEQIATFRPDPNTYVTPAIFGADYDPEDVHGGEGSFRMTATGAGAARGTLEFNPDRSFDDATAITFFAKGRAGGERVRVTLRDALDDDLGNAAPAAAPRLTAAGRLLEGWFSLTPEWRRYRIPRSALPDVDFRSLTKIEFHFGTEQGNPAGTTVWLDDIRWE